MTHFQVDAIKIENSPMALQRATTPDFKLLCQCLVETTDSTGTRSNSHQGLSDFPDFMGTCATEKHRESPHLLLVPHSGCNGQRAAYGTVLRGLWVPEDLRFCR